MAPASRSQPPLTREGILSAAIRLFQQHGFSGIGMRQIADLLRVKAPSLYHHFPSKEALAQAALEQYRQEQLVRLQQIDAINGLAQKLHAYAKLFGDMLSDGERPCMLLIMVQEPSSHGTGCADELRLFAKQNVDWLESVLRSCHDELRLDSGMAERRLAEMTFASLEGMMATALVSGEPAKSFRARASDYIDFMLKALAR